MGYYADSVKPALDGIEPNGAESCELDAWSEWGGSARDILRPVPPGSTYIAHSPI